jgi:tRNA pseudouridine38-40 synthase
MCTASRRGRTDAGVHAWGQVATFNTTSRLAAPQMLAGLRALLPEEIHPRALGRVALDFHARFSAQAKTYDYFLWPQAGPALFQRQRLWPLWRPLDEEALRQALEPLPGPRDLKPFASQGAEAAGSTVRRVFEARLDLGPRGLWRVRLTASGFLRHVVRNLVGELVMVGLGKARPDSILEACAAGRRARTGPKAPACGLYLNRVYYQAYPGAPRPEDAPQEDPAREEEA